MGRKGNVFDYKGTTIEVNSSGKFIATMDGVKIEADTLDAAKAKVDRELLGKKNKKPILNLKVVGLKIAREPGRYGRRYGGKVPCGPAHAVLTGVSRNNRSMQFNGIGKDDTLDDVIPDTNENFNLLKRKFELKGELENISEKVFDRKIKVDGYGNIDIEDYPRALKQLENQYKVAMARSNKKTKVSK